MKEELDSNGDESGDSKLLEMLINSLTNKTNEMKPFTITQEGAQKYYDNVINLINQIELSQNNSTSFKKFQ